MNQNIVSCPEIPAGFRVLFADDSAGTRKIFSKCMDELGVEVVSAEDGDLGLQALAEQIDRIDMIFSDINMPRMDGFEFCHKLQQADWYDGTPLVMVSTQSDADSVIRVLKLGADDYIPKRFDQEVIAQVIRRVLADG